MNNHAIKVIIFTIVNNNFGLSPNVIIPEFVNV